MDLWFLSDPARLTRERNALRDLVDEANWLEGAEWRFDDAGNLAVDAQIVAHGHTYCVRLSYPTHFPFAPPIVRPTNNERWSDHQYRDGTLCLEWGPDTWHSQVTGADVLASVYRLVDIEDPQGGEPRPPAPSRHFLTQGQELRRQFSRFYLTEAATGFLREQPIGVYGAFDYSYFFQRSAFTGVPTKFVPLGAEEWIDVGVPTGVRSGASGLLTLHGLFFVTDIGPQDLADIRDWEGIDRVLANAGLSSVSVGDSETYSRLGLTKCPGAVLIVDASGALNVFSLFETTHSAYRCSLVQSESSDTVIRTPSTVRGLAEKVIGVVGLGSLGSKLAISLARMGVTRFLLVDDDVFLPENACRNALDWRHIGQHKVDAVAECIEMIVSEASVETEIINLTGQENAAYLSGVLNRLSKCDVVFDMTANEQVFNLLTAVTVQSAKPIVWAEVFAGGFGGLVGRSRPKHDPDPQTMRAAFLHYTKENPYEGAQPTAPYAVANAAGETVVATDAAVSVIAAHATDLGVDTVLEREPSAYPNSLYLIGLAREWVFSAPFGTIPLETDTLPRASGTGPDPSEYGDDFVDFIKDLIRKTSGSDNPATSD